MTTEDQTTSPNELLAREFLRWQKQYMDEVHTAFMMQNRPAGQMAFESWERGFKIFLAANVPALHSIYRKRIQTIEVGWMNNSFNSTIAKMWQSQKGELIESFIDQAIKDVRAGRINPKGNEVVLMSGPSERSIVKESIFIGHGHSHTWKDLQYFLQSSLGLKCIEFNSESAAGQTNKERLEKMLDQANFAFLVMTGEDERADGTVHARENVIHEIGLFQGRLSFKRAIILLEEGCEEFSNIHGLVQIRFPKEQIAAVSEQIRDVLKREGILKSK
jgi:predicted nucleotide-binding protein